MARGPDPEVSAYEILTFMVQSPDPAFTAREIGDEFDKTRQWADNRLKSMEESGYLTSKSPGRRTRMYWVTDEGREYLLDHR